jgi:hypothetical protein
MANAQRSPYRQSELLDVELLDVFAQIEAMLRCGREVQRAALRVRGLPDPVSDSQRLEAARTIRVHLNNITEQCQALEEVLQDLHRTAVELEDLLMAERASSSET